MKLKSILAITASLLLAKASFADTRAYIPEWNVNGLEVVDVATDTVIGQLALPGLPSGVPVTTDGSKIYVSFQELAKIVVYQSDTLKPTAEIALEAGTIPKGLLLKPDNSKLYIASPNKGLIVANTATLQVEQTVAVVGGSFASVDFLTLNATQSLIYGMSEIGNVTVFSLADPTQGRRIYVSNRGLGFAGATVLLAHYQLGGATETPPNGRADIFTENGTGIPTVVASNIAIPLHPSAMVANPNGTYAYLSTASVAKDAMTGNVYTDQISIIRTSNGTTVASYSANLGFPFSVLGLYIAPNNKLYAFTNTNKAKVFSISPDGSGLTFLKTIDLQGNLPFIQSVDFNKTSNAQPIGNLFGTFSASSPEVQTSIPDANFGNEVVGGVSASRFVTINVKNLPLTLADISLDNMTDFTVLSNDCVFNQKKLLGYQCKVEIQFNPTSVGSKTANLTIKSPDTADSITTLTGTGIIPQLILSNNQLTFADQTISTQSAAQKITLTYQDVAFALSKIEIQGTDFQLGNNTCTLTNQPAGTICEIEVIFAPTSAGQKTANLVLGGPQGDQIVVLTGNALNPTPTTTGGSSSGTTAGTTAGTTTGTTTGTTSSSTTAGTTSGTTATTTSGTTSGTTTSGTTSGSPAPSPNLTGGTDVPNPATNSATGGCSLTASNTASAHNIFSMLLLTIGGIIPMVWRRKAQK